MMDCNCAAKRPVEEGTDSIRGCPKKLKLADAAPVEGRNAAAAAAHHGVEEALPKKKEVKRLSQRKIEWILSRTKRPPYCSPDEIPFLSRPGPGYSQAEADDFRDMLLSWNESREALWKMMSEMQEFVRREYAAKGFVEVDEDHPLFHGRDRDAEVEADHQPDTTMSDAELDTEEEDYAQEGYYTEEDYYPEEEYAAEEDNAAEEDHAPMMF